MNEHNDGEKQWRILHLEDSPRDAEIIRERLITEGFVLHLDWAANAQEFTSFLNSGEYDIVLADYQLPGFDAPEALRLSKSLCPDVPFICVSGAIGEDKAVDILKQGATDYVQKHNLDRLPLTIKRALDEGKERKTSKRTAEALRNSEKLYRSLFENMLNGFAYCQMHLDDHDIPWDFTYLSVNNAFETLTGLRNVAGKKVTEVIPGIREANPELLEIYGRVSKTGIPERFEVYLSSLQMWFWISVYSPERGYFVAVFEVITERKQAELKLRDALAEAQRFREALNHVSSHIYMKDAQSHYIYANQPTLELFGCSAEGLVGCDDTCFFPPDTVKRIREVDSRVFLGEQTSEEIDVVDEEGGRSVYWEVKAPIYAEPEFKTIWGLVGISTDMTALRQAEENYRTLFREMLDGFALHEILCDEENHPIDYRFLAVNPAFERMTGLKAEELVGRTVLETLPGTERFWIKIYGKVALTGEPAFLENYSAELKKHFEVTAFRPAPNQFACIFTDITERKRAEEEKIKLETKLQQAQKMEAIGTLAGGIAHDFNNILGAIIGYTEMSMDENQQKIQQQYLQETLKGAERAKNLVKQILTFSRQDGHEKKPLDIKILLKEAIKFLRASIPATIEIRQHFTDESCNIMADPTQMHQVIMNLCTNAAHAMKQTGGVLSLELSLIELSTADIPSHPDLKAGPHVKLVVSDTGHGIDPAHIQRIFDPFFTTKSKDEGTGLGLSVVYGIVKSHDGVITVYSEQGKGANFNVYLPRIIHEAVANGNISGTVVRGTERILFVDDEPALVDMGTRMLFSLGYAVKGVTGSIEALDLFRAESETFDLIITDMTLPKMTGIDLSREILQIRPDIPIILCSGIRESDTQEQVKSLGIRAYCIKPLTRKELAMVIRDTLDEHKKPIA